MEFCRTGFFSGSNAAPSLLVRSTRARACSQAGAMTDSPSHQPDSPGAAGNPPAGSGGRRALPAMLIGCAVAIGAVVGLALAGASAAAVVCAARPRPRRACDRLGLRGARHGGARRRGRDAHQRVETSAVGARDRPGRDRAAPVDGGRVPRRGHRRPHRAHRTLLGAAGRTHRDGRRVLRAPAPRRAAARRRQGRDPRRDPAQARTADARGARDRRDARRGGPPARARLLLLDPRHGRRRSPSATRRSGTAAATRAD